MDGPSGLLDTVVELRLQIITVLQCDGDGKELYTTFRLLAYVFIILYPIGVPCFFAFVLYSNYNDLFDMVSVKIRSPKKLRC